MFLFSGNGLMQGMKTKWNFKWTRQGAKKLNQFQIQAPSRFNLWPPINITFRLKISNFIHKSKNYSCLRRRPFCCELKTKNCLIIRAKWCVNRLLLWTSKLQKKIGKTFWYLFRLFWPESIMRLRWDRNWIWSVKDFIIWHVQSHVIVRIFPFWFA